MEHIAIDLGGQQSQICIRDSEGGIVLEKRAATPELYKHLASRKPGRVVVESCAEAFTVADWARQMGHEVRVVPAALVRVLGVGERGLKNDVRDARKLSETDCRMEVPHVHIPSQLSREKQARVTARNGLVEARTKLINTVRSYLRTLALPAIRATPKTLPKHVRSALQNHPNGLPDFLEHLLSVIDSMNVQIDKADQALEEVSESDPICKLLRSMPGVGPVTSIGFAAAIDDVARFESSAKLASYLGLTPGEKTTGFKTRRTGLTKAGPAGLRANLVQAAWTLVRTQPKSPLGLWYEQVAGRRGKKVAICALARRMAGILYAMWRDQKAYNPQLAESKPSRTTASPA